MLEVYLYGKEQDVQLAQALLRPVFPEITHSFPVYDLPDSPDQKFCRI